MKKLLCMFLTMFALGGTSIADQEITGVYDSMSHIKIAKADMNGDGTKEIIFYKPFVSGSQDKQWLKVRVLYADGTYNDVKYDITGTSNDALIYGRPTGFYTGTSDTGVKSFGISFEYHPPNAGDQVEQTLVDISDVGALAANLDPGESTLAPIQTVYDPSEWASEITRDQNGNVVIQSIGFSDSWMDYSNVGFYSLGDNADLFRYRSLWALGHAPIDYDFVCRNIDTGAIVAGCGPKQVCGLPYADPLYCTQTYVVDRGPQGGPPEYWHSTEYWLSVPCEKYVGVEIYTPYQQRLVDVRRYYGACEDPLPSLPRRD